MKEKMMFLCLFVVNLCSMPNLSSGELPLDAKIYVAGHHGLVGSAIVRKLQSEGYTNIVTRSSKELDLRVQQAVNEFFAQEKPDYVFLAAAKVGGIKANSDYPAEFIYDNLMIEANVIHAAYQAGVKKLLFLGSSCIYPKECPHPMLESYLLTGTLEPTNEPYAVAKIAGIKLCQSYNRQYGTNFISCMPTNLYGPNDNFDLTNSHVLPALIRKFTDAKSNHAQKVVLWGTGKPRREFLHVDDLANAALYLMRHYDGNEIVNVGCGQDVSILELALMIKDIVGYEGDIVFDTSYPDGTYQKLLNIDKILELGWKPAIPLYKGIRDVVQWYLENRSSL
jgi:GDP-L-fucose synthase